MIIASSGSTKGTVRKMRRSIAIMLAALVVAGCGGKSQSDKIKSEACASAQFLEQSAILANDQKGYERAKQQEAENC